ncbi:MAG: hypothetical protein HC905_30170 [Bacteroidales bacterium]|nr:hypothetical protein [Bacteroidales bacterium]
MGKSLTKLLICGVICFFTSCSKDKETKPSLPEITSVYPLEATAYTELTIKGTGFPNTDSSLIQVRLNDNSCELVRVLHNELHVLVPLKAGSGNISVYFDTLKIVGPEVSYIPSYSIKGQDMGRYYQNIYVKYEENTITDAIVKVNNTIIPLFQTRYYGNLPESLQTDDIITLTVNTNGKSFSATGKTPAIPELISPKDGSSIKISQNLEINWNSATDPDFF